DERTHITITGPQPAAFHRSIHQARAEAALRSRSPPRGASTTARAHAPGRQDQVGHPLASVSGHWVDTSGFPGAARSPASIPCATAHVIESALDPTGIA